jgi:hypothetical protein
VRSVRRAGRRGPLELRQRHRPRRFNNPTLVLIPTTRAGAGSSSSSSSGNGNGGYNNGSVALLYHNTPFWGSGVMGALRAGQGYAVGAATVGTRPGVGPHAPPAAVGAPLRGPLRGFAGWAVLTIVASRCRTTPAPFFVASPDQEVTAKLSKLPSSPASSPAACTAAGIYIYPTGTPAQRPGRRQPRSSTLASSAIACIEKIGHFESALALEDLPKHSPVVV